MKTHKCSVLIRTLSLLLIFSLIFLPFQSYAKYAPNKKAVVTKKTVKKNQKANKKKVVKKNKKANKKKLVKKNKKLKKNKQVKKNKLKKTKLVKKNNKKQKANLAKKNKKAKKTLNNKIKIQRVNNDKNTLMFRKIAQKNNTSLTKIQKSMSRFLDSSKALHVVDFTKQNLSSYLHATVKDQTLRKCIRNKLAQNYSSYILDKKGIIVAKNTPLFVEGVCGKIKFRAQPALYSVQGPDYEMVVPHMQLKNNSSVKLQKMYARTEDDGIRYGYVTITPVGLAKAAAVGLAGILLGWWAFSDDGDDDSTELGNPFEINAEIAEQIANSPLNTDNNSSDDGSNSDDGQSASTGNTGTNGGETGGYASAGGGTDMFDFNPYEDCGDDGNITHPNCTGDLNAADYGYDQYEYAGGNVSEDPDEECSPGDPTCLTCQEMQFQCVLSGIWESNNSRG